MKLRLARLQVLCFFPLRPAKNSSPGFTLREIAAKNFSPCFTLREIAAKNYSPNFTVHETSAKNSYPGFTVHEAAFNAAPGFLFLPSTSR